MILRKSGADSSEEAAGERVSGVRAEHLATLKALLKSGLVERWLQRGLEAKGAGLEAKPHFTLQV